MIRHVIRQDTRGPSGWHRGCWGCGRPIHALHADDCPITPNTQQPTTNTKDTTNDQQDPSQR